MSFVTSDYFKPASGAPSCSYANLGGYNDGYSMSIAPQGKVTSGMFLVPSFSPITYDSLTAKAPNCTGYFDINQAYGKDAASCQTTYRTSLCGSSNSGK